MFDISLTDELVTEPVSEGATGSEAVYGRIRIGDYQETFITSLSFWNRPQYERHWATALQRIVGGKDRSALITSCVEPPLDVTSDDFLVWWPLYRDGDTGYVQNQLLFFKQLSSPFSLDRAWESVRERQVVNVEGSQISEWITNVQNIRDYLNRTGAG
jgi:hypothetical protein